MAGITNRGKLLLLEWAVGRTTPPTNFYLALCTSATTPTADINTLGELTQIAVGNGYSNGGISINRNSTDWDTGSEDDTSDYGLVRLKDIVFTASGGTLPGSGSGATYAVLTDDNATVANRQVIAYGTLTGAPLSVSDTQALTVQDFTLRGNES